MAERSRFGNQAKRSTNAVVTTRRPDPCRTLAVAAAGTLLILVAFTTPLTTLASTAAGLVSGWNVAVLVTAGFSLLGALTVLLARERSAGPKPDPCQVQQGRRDRGEAPRGSELSS